MNGQKLAQNDATGEWKTEKMTKAEGIKPGIYNLYNAVAANKTKDNIGEVLHIDLKDNVLYQKNGAQYIKHDLDCFDKDNIPSPGLMANIKYNDSSKVSIEDVSHKHKQGMKR